MDLRQIRCFVAVYEERSLTRAAARLHVVQPAVSAMIRQLESRRNVQLFERTSLGVAPTVLAHAVYQRCCSILRQTDELAAMFTGSQTERERLVIGLPPSMASGGVSEALLEFVAQYPEVALEVREGYSASLIDSVVAGQIDVALVGVDEAETRVAVQQLFSERLRLVVSEAHPLPRGGVRASAAAAMDLILPTLGNPLRLLLEREFGRHGIVLAPALEIDSLQATLALVRGGHHATILPGSVLEGVAGIDSVPLCDPAIERALVAVHGPGRALSAPAQRLVERLRGILAERLPEQVHAQRGGLSPS